jgi:hypothetical protein
MTDGIALVPSTTLAATASTTFDWRLIVVAFMPSTTRPRARHAIPIRILQTNEPPQYLENSILLSKLIVCDIQQLHYLLNYVVSNGRAEFRRSVAVVSICISNIGATSERERFDAHRQSVGGVDISRLPFVLLKS